MNFVLNFPLFLIVASLFTSVICTLLNGKLARLVNLALTLASFICNALVFVYVLKEGVAFTYMMGHFPHPWGNELKISILEASISTLFSLVFFLTILGGKESIKEYVKEERLNQYYALCNLIQASILVLVYTNDIFTGYVFIEICTLASCGIVIVKDSGKSLAAAIRYMVFALIGSGLLLFGIVFLYNITGNLLMPNLKESISAIYSVGQYKLPLLTAMCFISVGIGIKSGLFPFHFWMADMYGESAPTSSGLLSGIISKSYIFYLIKIINDCFTLDIFKSSGIANIILFLALCGVIVGSISAVKEDNIFKMTAYSSAAQIAYIYIGVGLGSKAALIASLFQICAHCVTKPAIFLANYRLSKVSGNHHRFKYLYGAGLRDKFAAVCFTVEALSMVGIPLTAGFITKYLFGIVVFDFTNIEMIFTLITLVISTILNTIYFTRLIVYIYTTKKEEKVFEKTKFTYAISGTLFIILNLMLGISANTIIEIFKKGIEIF